MYESSETTFRKLDHRPRLNHELTNATHSTDDMIVIEAPGLEPCEIRVMLIAGNLSIRGEKLDLKGKGKENEGFSQSPSKIRNHLEVEIELPIGIQVRLFPYPRPASR